MSRIGRKVAATIQTWTKGPAKSSKTEPAVKTCTITFVIDRIDDFWANYGPATHIALSLPGRRRVHEIVSGEFRAGALIVKLPPRVETT
jgi:hypothetical protein